MFRVCGCVVRRPCRNQWGSDAADSHFSLATPRMGELNELSCKVDWELIAELYGGEDGELSFLMKPMVVRCLLSAGWSGNKGPTLEQYMRVWTLSYEVDSCNSEKERKARIARGRAVVEKHLNK